MAPLLLVSLHALPGAPDSGEWGPFCRSGGVSTETGGIGSLVSSFASGAPWSR